MGYINISHDSAVGQVSHQQSQSEVLIQKEGVLQNLREQDEPVHLLDLTGLLDGMCQARGGPAFNFATRGI